MVGKRDADDTKTGKVRDDPPPTPSGGGDEAVPDQTQENEGPLPGVLVPDPKGNPLPPDVDANDPDPPLPAEGKPGSPNVPHDPKEAVEGGKARARDEAEAPPKRGPGRPRKNPSPEMYAVGAARPKTASAKNPDKVPYAVLAAQLVDFLIEATEGYPRASRFAVAKNTIGYALRLLPRQYVDKVKGSAA